jgi:hypothetical protein
MRMRVLSDPGPDDVSPEPPFGSFQFTVLQGSNALLDMGPGLDGVPSLCALQQVTGVLGFS